MAIKPVNFVETCPQHYELSCWLTSIQPKICSLLDPASVLWSRSFSKA